MTFHFSRTLFCAAACFGLCSMVYGDAINGDLQLAGGVIVGETTIDFVPPGTGGQIGVEGAFNTGSFAGFNMPANPTSTTTIQIMDLTGPPISGTVAVPNFITFVGTYLAGTALNLNLISPGSDLSAGCTTDENLAMVGQTCTPPNSPFNLQNVQDSHVAMVPPGTPCRESGISNPNAVNCAVAISFLFAGTVLSPDGDPGTFTGTFDTQTTPGTSSVANPETIEDILAALEQNNGTGTVSESFSGVITATSSTPEPDSWMLMAGIGMVGLGLLGKKSRRSTQV